MQLKWYRCGRWSINVYKISDSIYLTNGIGSLDVKILEIKEPLPFGTKETKVKLSKRHIIREIFK